MELLEELINKLEVRNGIQVPVIESVESIAKVISEELLLSELKQHVALFSNGRDFLYPDIKDIDIVIVLDVSKFIDDTRNLLKHIKNQKGIELVKFVFFVYDKGINTDIQNWAYFKEECTDKFELDIEIVNLDYEWPPITEVVNGWLSTTETPSYNALTKIQSKQTIAYDNRQFNLEFIQKPNNTIEVVSHDGYQVKYWRNNFEQSDLNCIDASISSFSLHKPDSKEVQARFYYFYFNLLHPEKFQYSQFIYHDFYQRALNRLLTICRSETSNLSVIIMGPKGVGKSTLVKLLDESLATDGEQSEGVGYIDKSTFLDKDEYHEPSAGENLNKIFKVLKSRNSQHGVLIIDDFDWLAKEPEKLAKFVDVYGKSGLAGDHKFHIIFVSCLSVARCKEAISLIIGDQLPEKITLNGFENLQAIDVPLSRSVSYIDAQLLTFFELPLEIISNEVKERIIKVANNIPYYIRLVLYHYLSAQYYSTELDVSLDNVLPSIDLSEVLNKQITGINDPYFEKIHQALIHNHGVLTIEQFNGICLDVLESEREGKYNESQLKDYLDNLVQAGWLQPLSPSDGLPKLLRSTVCLVYGYWQKSIDKHMLVQLAYVLASKQRIGFNWFETYQTDSIRRHYEKEMGEKLKINSSQLKWMYEGYLNEGSFDDIPPLWLSWQLGLLDQLQPSILAELE